MFILLSCLFFAWDISADEVSDDLRLAGECLNALSDSPNSPMITDGTFLKLKGLCEKYAGSSASSAFFSYLKNIYESHKQNGRYGRAVTAVSYLLKIQEDPNYYIDRGNIYLHGFNNPKGAIENFEKAVMLNPKHPSAYTDLGLAYEILGDYDKAVIAYRRAAGNYPLGHWSLYGVKRIDAINLTKGGQLIKDWLFLGPFDNAESSGELEDKIIKSTYADESPGWFRPHSYSDFGYVNLSNLFSRKDFVMAYALTHIWAPVERRVFFKAGSDDGITIWLNKKKVWDNKTTRAAAVDNDVIGVTLEKGWNTVLVSVTQSWGSWGFYFRVTDLKGQPLDELIFDPAKDSRRASGIYAAKEKAKFLNMAKTASLYSLALVLVAALALTLTLNIINSAKIKRLREDFISSITHDLRIPLSAIMAHIEMLQDGKVKDENKISRYYNTIASEANRLNRHLTKILEFSKTGERPYSFKSVDIVPILKEVIEGYSYESPSENLDITLNAAGAIPLAEVDEEAFSQAIINLLSNADKYSPKDKRIKVCVKTLDNKILVSVEDHGIGIRQEDKKRIFTKFYRADEKEVHESKGLGLGLAFVKNIVEAHKGRIAVEGRPGIGSIFTIELPIPSA